MIRGGERSFQLSKCITSCLACVLLLHVSTIVPQNYGLLAAFQVRSSVSDIIIKSIIMHNLPKCPQNIKLLLSDSYRSRGPSIL